MALGNSQPNTNSFFKKNFLFCVRISKYKRSKPVALSSLRFRSLFFTSLVFFSVKKEKFVTRKKCKKCVVDLSSEKFLSILKTRKENEKEFSSLHQHKEKAISFASFVYDFVIFLLSFFLEVA